MTNTILPGNNEDNISEITTNNFFYLDLEFFWNADGELEFQTHREIDKKFKSLNKESTHTNASFNAIPSGIFNRLVKLTSIAKKNAQMRIEKNIKDTPRR